MLHRFNLLNAKHYFSASDSIYVYKLYINQLQMYQHV